MGHAPAPICARAFLREEQPPARAPFSLCVCVHGCAHQPVPTSSLPTPVVQGVPVAPTGYPGPEVAWTLVPDRPAPRQRPSRPNHFPTLALDELLRTEAPPRHRNWPANLPSSHANWVLFVEGTWERFYRRLKGRTCQNLWSCWARLRNTLSDHAWDEIRKKEGMTGRQPKAKVAPGPAARVRVPFTDDFSH